MNKPEMQFVEVGEVSGEELLRRDKHCHHKSASPAALARYAKQQREVTKKRRRNLLKLFGGKCFVCGETRKVLLRMHDKDDVPLQHSTGTAVYKRIIENPRDYVLLCKFCCRSLWWLVNRFNMGWREIERILNKRRGNVRQKFCERDILKSKSDV